MKTVCKHNSKSFVGIRTLWNWAWVWGKRLSSAQRILLKYGNNCFLGLWRWLSWLSAGLYLLLYQSCNIRSGVVSSNLGDCVTICYSLQCTCFLYVCHVFVQGFVLVISNFVAHTLCFIVFTVLYACIMFYAGKRSIFTYCKWLTCLSFFMLSC